MRESNQSFKYNLFKQKMEQEYFQLENLRKDKDKWKQ